MKALILMGCLAVAAAAAQAQTQPPSAESILKKIDENPI